MIPQPIDLSPLKDIHVLPEPPFFPPSAGWWLVLDVFLSVLFVMWLWYRFYYMSPKRYALRLLKRLQKASLPPVSMGVETGKLLKRVALVCFPPHQVADLSGQAWADFLYQNGNGALTPQQADFIAQSAYLPIEKIIAIDDKTFYTAVYKWIISVFKKRSHGN